MVTGGTSCVPYICSSATGTCLQSCTSVVDCVPGYEGTSEQRCVPEQGPEDVEVGSCGCRLPRRVGGGAGPLGALGLLGLALARRRRRSGRPGLPVDKGAEGRLR